MNNSKELEESYFTLKNKVEQRIKLLESEVFPPNPQNNPHTHQHCHNNCHHHCHSISSSQVIPHIYPHRCNGTMNNIQMINSECYMSTNKIIPSNYVSENVLSNAMIEHLRNQRQMALSIKNMNEKIQILSAKNSKSHYSDAFSESTDQRHIINSNKTVSIVDDQKMRSRSQMKKSFNMFNKVDKNLQLKKIDVKSMKSKIKMGYVNNTHLSQPANKSKWKNEISNVKSESRKKLKSKDKSQYFVNGLCLLHSPPKIISLKSIKMKQIYKDSQYRNQKHQKNHLLQSFRQQQKSRNKLLQKIVSNVLNQYGRK